MVNFMRQFYWAKRYPDTWQNIILGVSVRVFPEEINIFIMKLKKISFTSAGEQYAMH